MTPLGGPLGVQDVWACLRDVHERLGVLSGGCRGKEQALDGHTRQWRGVAGAEGVITCSKDMVSRAHAARRQRKAEGNLVP